MNARTQSAADANRTVDHDNFAVLVPPVDIYEDETGFTLIADLPGVSKERLGVKVNGDNLTIEGEVSVPSPQGMELFYAELPASRYERGFTLSRELDASRIEANLKDGVLKLRIPKAEEARPRRIDIKVG
jgi:HSP20 family protein